MNHIGNYHIKPFSKHRQNIVLITKEGGRKHSVHAYIELDVTDARENIKKIFKKNGEKYSFTGWICKCVAESLCKHTDLNAYRLGKRKIVVFDDVDIGIIVERIVNGKLRPLGYVLRKVNEKKLNEITKEIVNKDGPLRLDRVVFLPDLTRDPGPFGRSGNVVL